MSPKYVAALLLAAFIVAQAIRRASAGRTAAPPAGRGTRIVFFGACAIVLLALAWPAPAAPLLPLWAQWLGVAATLAGLTLHGAWSRARDARMSDLADIAIWSGAAAASSSLPVFGSVAVALIAAYAVRISTFTH